MSNAQRASWFVAAVLVGCFYAVVGITFALPPENQRSWRLAAWGVSGLAYAAHLMYERLAQFSPPARAASHAAVAAALGAFGLAIGALVHSLATGMPGEHQRRLLIALAAWPAVTGIPAFVVGLAAANALAQVTRTTRVQR